MTPAPALIDMIGSDNRILTILKWKVSTWNGGPQVQCKYTL